MKPFKNRVLKPDIPVKLYRNLHKKGRWYSLMQDRLVRAHATTRVYLKDCELVVQKSGWNRFKKTGIRNVYAFVKGYLTDNPRLAFSFLLEYNLQENYFYCELGGDIMKLTKVSCVYLQDGLVYCQL